MLTLEQIDLHLQDGSDEVRILSGISLGFEPGKLYVITGPNGGGKTSIARVIAGIFHPSRGRIIFNGTEITDWSITERAKQGIRYAFQNPPRFKGIDIGWYLRLAYPEITDNQMRSAMAKIGLCPENYLDRVVDNTLSGGEMKRLEVASVLLGPTQVAVLDEPEAGVDLWSFEQLRDFVVHSHQHSAGRITIIISHNERFLEIADEIIVIAAGVVQEQGTMETIRPLIEEGINCRWRNICLGEED